MAKSRKKKQTPTQKAYYKERRRIQQFISRTSKRGYFFETNPLPSIPKNITQASVNRLKKLTAKELYRKAEYVVPSTGEVISALRGRYYERQASAEKAKKTRAERITDKFVRDMFDEDWYNGTSQYNWDDDISQVPYSEEEPVVDKWAEIGRRLQEEFPTRIMVTPKKGGKGKGYEVDAFAMRNSLYDIWRNTDSEIEDRRALNRYVEAHEAEFAEAMDAIAVYTAGDGEIIITHDSVLSNSITKLANFLNYGQMLTQNQAENLDWVGDYYGNI